MTISIAASNRPRLIAERSLPSALAQTHERVEVVVVGDAVGPEVAAVVEAAGDPRARFVNLTQRWVPDGDRHWLTASTLARNEAYRLARGRWLVDLDDDDALRPEAVERLLARALERRLEVVHGDLELHAPDGRTELIGSFPPVLGQFGWQGAIVHAGLRFFAREHIAADLGLPGDWFRAERMLRAGVRFGRLEQATCDYYPSKLWSAGGSPAASTDSTTSHTRSTSASGRPVYSGSASSAPPSRSVTGSGSEGIPRKRSIACSGRK